MSYQEPPIEPKYESPPTELRFHRDIEGRSLHLCSALLMGMDNGKAQQLLDDLGSAIDRGMIRTTPEQWLRGAVRIRTTGGGIQGVAAELSEGAYMDALVGKGLSPDDAAAIAAKTVRSRS